MKVSAKFTDSLKPEQLAFADNLAVRVLHVIRLKRSAYEDDVDDLSKHLTKKDREKKLAAIDPDRKALWSAYAICGVRGATGNWGHIQRYYWSPREAPSLHLVCKACMKAWKKLGEPEIASFDRSASNEEAWPWDLPFGWVEVATKGHPWDVAPDDDPELVKDKTGEVQGVRRTEIRRFQRGPAIVRLVHLYADNTYEARYWTVNGGLTDDKWNTRSALKDAREECHRLMAKGGYP